jgi:polysaccharide export outer membrane protein
MARWVLFLITGALLFGFTAYSRAAQSTADVPVTRELREAARAKVLGKSGMTAVSEEYVIGHGDVLSVQVYGEGDMSAIATSTGPTIVKSPGQEDSPRLPGGGVQVRIDGRISLKHIGEVEAVGLTLTQLADYLKELYASVFGDPNVTVVLVQGNSQRYTVMGKVLKPGVYHIDYPINIVQAVARAGGFAEWTKNIVTLVRNSPKNEKKLFKGNTLEFDYGDFLNGKELERNVLLEPGDIIIVK